ncbi:MAG: ParB/RepB/Spo0J family partition protein [Erysipelotrichales bacterium]|nr:ParB/RepB/Spo0J family partition protein [Erysipelotrichales bacterium]
MNIVRNISLSDIKANPYQPRTEFDEEKLKELAASIQKDGLIEPVILRKASKGYEIIAGERRCRASRLAGLSQVPAIVMNADASKSARLALIENIQREDLNAMEEAKAFAQLLRIEECTQEELAKRLGKSQSAIANKIRLLNLHEDVQNGLTAGWITERQARALLTVPKERQSEMMERIRLMDLDSRGTEVYLKEIKKQEEKEKKKKPARKNKVFLRDARIAVNTIDSAIKSIRQTNIKIDRELEESEDEYTMTIHIRKLENVIK